ncbi:636_t:CDS:2 [Cetraspora pellucida]|uniref:636_t:CDS:1 n=1 Tax=Cetraspora pellucida TaxID=1433469 RepID=A0A9N8VMB0_9GLOM|nr:636_t:CDS:2 [Cetraspora pellucida]
MSENYFYLNHNQPSNKLKEAITMCRTNNSKNKRKLVEILSQFNVTSKRVKLGNSCLKATMVTYTKIVCHLECLDLVTIKPEVPLASGIIDLSGNEDPFVNLLSSRSEQTNKSSQSRMERIEAMNSRMKPDLQVLLKLDTVKNEIVLAEVLQLLPQQDKEIID